MNGLRAIEGHSASVAINIYGRTSFINIASFYIYIRVIFTLNSYTNCSM